jgi:hypothetical protein
MHFSNPCSRAKGFVLSPLPELGTMGSKWGGARVTGSSTSSRICSVPGSARALGSLAQCSQPLLSLARGWDLGLRPVGPSGPGRR